MVTDKKLIDYDKLDHRMLTEDEQAKNLRIFDLGGMYDTSDFFESGLRVKYFKSCEEYIKIRTMVEKQIRDDQPVDPEIEDRLKKEFKHLIETNQL